MLRVVEIDQPRKANELATTERDERDPAICMRFLITAMHRHGKICGHQMLEDIGIVVLLCNGQHQPEPLCGAGRSQGCDSSRVKQR